MAIVRRVMRTVRGKTSEYYAMRFTDPLTGNGKARYFQQQEARAPSSRLTNHDTACWQPVTRETAANTGVSLYPIVRVSALVSLKGHFEKIRTVSARQSLADLAALCRIISRLVRRSHR